MGFLDVFRKKPANKQPAPREFTMTVAGFGIQAQMNLPVGVSHMDGGTLIFGPMNVGRAGEKMIDGRIQNVLMKPGEPPSGQLAKQESGKDTPVTFSTGQAGTTMLVLGLEMTGFDAFLESFTTADHPAHWTLTTDDHVIRWPSSLTLRADGDMDPRSWPYEFGLNGSSEHLLYLQGPVGQNQIPNPEHLVAPGMEMVDHGDMPGTVNTILWFELGYEHEGVGWKQRFYYLPIDSESIYMLRAQCSVDVADTMFAAADLVASSFEPVN